jgi:hypothetical protein
MNFTEIADVIREAKCRLGEYERRIALACEIIDHQRSCERAKSPERHAEILDCLRAVLDEGARPDLGRSWRGWDTKLAGADQDDNPEPDPWADGTMRDGMRGFTGGKP